MTRKNTLIISDLNLVPWHDNWIPWIPPSTTEIETKKVMEEVIKSLQLRLIILESREHKDFLAEYTPLVWKENYQQDSYESFISKFRF